MQRICQRSLQAILRARFFVEGGKGIDHQPLGPMDSSLAEGDSIPNQKK